MLFQFVKVVATGTIKKAITVAVQLAMKAALENIDDQLVQVRNNVRLASRYMVFLTRLRWKRRNSQTRRLERRLLRICTQRRRLRHKIRPRRRMNTPVPSSSSPIATLK